MEIDVRMILTLGGMLASVVTAFVIVKTKLQAVIEQLSDIENRFRSMDKNNDSQEVTIQNHAQRLDVISGMLAPKEREARARQRLMRSVKKLINYLICIMECIHQNE